MKKIAILLSVAFLSLMIFVSGPTHYRWQTYSYSGSGNYNFWRLAP